MKLSAMISSRASGSSGGSGPSSERSEDQVAGGEKVVTRFIVHFTHDRGEIMGVAPSASPDEMVVKVYPLKYETTDLCASLE